MMPTRCFITANVWCCTSFLGLAASKIANASLHQCESPTTGISHNPICKCRRISGMLLISNARLLKLVVVQVDLHAEAHKQHMQCPSPRERRQSAMGWWRVWQPAVSSEHVPR